MNGARLPLVARVRSALAAGFLLAQLGFVGYSRFVSSRYFCWAPFSAQSRYHIAVTLHAGTPQERRLSENEVSARYRLPNTAAGSGEQWRWEENSIQHAIDLIQQYEQTYGLGEHACVVVRYSTNGADERQWRSSP